jgi:type IV pilus assembly protein PilF
MSTLKPLCILLGLALSLSACVSERAGAPGRDIQQVVNTRMELGYRYLNDGNRESARRQFMDVIKLDSGVAEAYLGVARVHEANQEVEQADSFYRKALGKRPADSKAALQLAYGQFLWNQKRYKEAAKQFEAAGKDYDYPGRSLGIYWWARCQAQLGDIAKAKANYQYALNLRADMGEPYLELADLAFSERDYQSAEQQYEKFTQLSKQNPRSLWLGIRLHRILGHDDKVASYALVLRNLYGSSEEYLEYQRLIGQ